MRTVESMRRTPGLVRPSISLAILVALPKRKGLMSMVVTDLNSYT